MVFHTLEASLDQHAFKDADIRSLRQAAEETIDAVDPDIVLVDLRLLEEDFRQDTIRKLGGFQIIQAIHKHNPGIQMIAFSASSDSLIIDDLLRQDGILGYVKKDSPTNKYVAPKNSVSKLIKLIKHGVDRAYLKEIWNTQQKLLTSDFLTHNSSSTIYQLRQNSKDVFEILNSKMPSAFRFAMLTIFKCFELISEYYIEERFLGNKKYAFWKGSKTKIKTLNSDKLIEITKDGYNLSTENKIRAILDAKTSLQDSAINRSIKQLVCSRNYAMHPQEKDTCRDHLVPQPKSEDIIRWFHLLNHILQSLKKSS
jgi:DNA-binding NarL/FixJ family response regulator